MDYAASPSECTAETSSTQDFDTIKSWKAFDADRGKDTAREIREYYIPDFFNWKDHDSFETEFGKLLDALKKDEKIAEPERE